MSEYQYYEFLAIDRPLTSEEMSGLRSISSRAQITPVSLSNFYNFGDFKGDPDKLMQQYFDAHVYDEACQALLDLSEAYALVGRSKSFELKLDEFMTAHQRRKAFVERLRRSKIWRQK